MDESAEGAIFWRDAGIHSARDSHSALWVISSRFLQCIVGLNERTRECPLWFWTPLKMAVPSNSALFEGIGGDFGYSPSLSVIVGCTPCVYFLVPAPCVFPYLGLSLSLKPAACGSSAFHASFATEQLTTHGSSRRDFVPSARYCCHRGLYCSILCPC